MATMKLGRRTTLRQLKSFLEENGIDFNSWRKPESKTLKELHRELRQGICTLAVRDGRAIRTTQEVAVDICHPLTSDVAHLLIERWQEVSHGDKKHIRRRDAYHTLKGKIEPEETHEHAAYRCIKDKLGIKPPYKKLGKLKHGQSAFLVSLAFLRKQSSSNSVCGLIEVLDYPLEERDTEGYPGLPTKRTRKLFVFVVSKEYHKLKERKRKRGAQRTSYGWSPKHSDEEHYLFQPIGTEK